METFIETAKEIAIFAVSVVLVVGPIVCYFVSEAKRDAYYGKELQKAREDGDDKLADMLYADYKRKNH